MKKFITDSKMRIAGAGIAAAILMILSVLAVKADGMIPWKLVLSLVLALLFGGSILLKGSFSKVISTVLFFLLPAAALCCMEFYTHVPWDLTPPIFLLNYLCFLLLFFIGTAIFGNSRWGCVFGTAVPMIFGLVNYYVVMFRSSPVVPWDLYSLGTAVSVVDNYELEVPFRLLFVLFGFLAVIALGSRTNLTFPKKKWIVRVGAIVLSLGVFFGYVAAVKTDTVGELVGLDDILFTPNVLYRNNGFMGAFLSNLKYMDVEKPEGYSAEKAEKLAEEVSAEEKTESTLTGVSKERPNIIVIMNEAFSDLSVYGEFATSEDYMPFIRSLDENTEKGDLYVSVRGGNTANTEFEFLTGNSMAFLPAGSVPYQQYLKQETPSIASYLGKLGYATYGLHPYRAEGWNRNQVYPWLGFENSCFRDDFEEVTLLRGYVDDASAYQKLIDLYETKKEDQPMFAFEVTMQNHGGYSKEYTDLFPDIKIEEYIGRETTSTQSTEKYLTLIQKSDQAFEELVSYFEQQEEPTMILMFGDHQPSDYICNPIMHLMGQDASVRETSVDEFRKGYVVPYILWSNYDRKTEDGGASMSANYLGGYLLSEAGLPLSGYQTWLKGLQEEYPVVTANFYAEFSESAEEKNDLIFREWEELPGNTKIADYAILQYNNLSDWKHRILNFFD